MTLFFVGFVSLSANIERFSVFVVISLISVRHGSGTALKKDTFPQEVSLSDSSRAKYNDKIFLNFIFIIW